MRRRRLFALGLGLAACAAGCGVTRSGGTGGGTTGDALGRVSVVPGDPRWEVMARTLYRTMRRTGVPAAGTGGQTTITVTGLYGLAAAEIGGHGSLQETTTPLARLTGHVEAVMVPANSRFKHFDDLAADLLSQPDRAYLAGGPVGEPDHLLFGLIAQGLGADARRIDYTGYPGQDEVATALLGGHAAAATGRLADWRGPVERGRVRVLAVSSANRVPGVEAPSLLECGVRIDFADWCAVVGPGRMDAGRRAAAVSLCESVAGSGPWQEACRDGGWDSIPLTGDGFATWLAAESVRTRKVLRDLGLLDTPGTTYRG
ncbi:tripartite tricarboxylate transporter substrate-binding protein [Nonomuraea longicatena]